MATATQADLFHGINTRITLVVGTICRAVDRQLFLETIGGKNFGTC